MLSALSNPALAFSLQRATTRRAGVASRVETTNPIVASGRLACEMSWSCLLMLICLLLGLGPCAAQQQATATHAAADAALLRQSQNTFVQWVLSLLPTRPPGMITIESVNATLSPFSSSITPATQAPAVSSTTAAATTPTAATATTTLRTTRAPSTTTTSTQAPFTTTPAPVSSSSTTTRRATTPATPTQATASNSTELTPPRNCSDCICGVANIQKRIVGGQETEIHQYPWVGMLLYGGRFYCAASLINDQYLLTASHCVHGFRKERITVRLLEHDRKQSHIQKIDRNVALITTHPKYNARTYDNDIAIIRLDEPVEFNELLHPVCMPTPGRSFKGETAIVTGWGALKVGGPTSDTLQEVQVPVMSQEDCRKSRYGASRITDNMLCAGFDDGKKDSCQGDSGGPLHIVATGTREHQIAGVVSWGEGCAKAGYPGVYARVNRYGTWIKNLTKQACLCHSETKKIK